MRRETLSSLIDRMRLRKKAYQVVLAGPGAPLFDCLADLAVVCHAHGTTFHENDREHARREGRREVWQHIQNYLRLEPEHLAQLKIVAIEGEKQ